MQIVYVSEVIVEYFLGYSLFLMLNAMKSAPNMLSALRFVINCTKTFLQTMVAESL